MSEYPFDARLDDVLLATIERGAAAATLDVPADLLLYDLLRYHLGFVNERFEPERVNAGKRIRPKLCVLVCQASNGDADQAIRAAAAIELLHNFTLIHDDIQDQSPLRRHRRTIWSRWGIAQAINAGDAMFALAHLALNRSIDVGVDPALVMELSTALHETTLRIVEGQVLDLGFEERADVSVADYYRMIGGKTGALARCACWFGARIAGVDAETTETLAEFGAVLGVGFQLRDDILGVWGDPAATGKAWADDIRRRKKSLPVLLLRERLISDDDRRTVDRIYAHDDVTADEVETVLAMMRHYEVEQDVQEQVSRWHDRARTILDAAVLRSTARDELMALMESLEVRVG